MPVLRLKVIASVEAETLQRASLASFAAYRLKVIASVEAETSAGYRFRPP